MKIPDFVFTKPPKGEEQLKKVYGIPWQDNSHWYATNMTRLILPSPFALLWKTNFVMVHREVSFPLDVVLKAIEEAALCERIKEYNGIYNLRKIRGGERYSIHSFGAAIDLNASQDPLGDTKIDMDPQVVEIFESVGWSWGGRWKRPDAMHYQWGGY